MLQGLTRKKFALFASTLAISLTIIQVYSTAIGVVSSLVQRGIHLGLVMALVFLWFPTFKGADETRYGKGLFLLDLVLAGVSMAIALHLVCNMDYFQTRWLCIDNLTPLDLIYGGLLIVLSLEITRSLTGWPMVVVSTAALVYALCGSISGSASANVFATGTVTIPLMKLWPRSWLPALCRCACFLWRRICLCCTSPFFRW